jgi:hypothetical protein
VTDDAPDRDAPKEEPPESEPPDDEATEKESESAENEPEEKEPIEEESADHESPSKQGVPREGWNVPRPATIPRPTAWPAGLALGVTILAWGLVTSLIMVSVGLAVVVVCLAGWIGEMRHERRQES